MATKKEKDVKTKIDITKTEPLDKNADTKKDTKKKENNKAKTNKTTKIKKVNASSKVVEETVSVQAVNKYNLTAVAMIALALFIFSFVIAAQLNTVGNTNIISQGMREAEILRELQNMKEEYETLKEQYEESQEIVEEYKTSSSSNDALIAAMKSELDKANILAGLVDVRGEGVVITLKDSTDTEISLEAGLVHDTDITAIVTELKAAGAEAISINGQRVISTTAIRCVGPTIQVNSVKVASPFYIKAIGNSKYLESALNIKNGVVDSLKSYGIDVEIETNNSITIDKYDLTLKMKYAKEIK